MDGLNRKMTLRHSLWTAFLVNLTNLARGIDGAQAILLKETPIMKELLEVAAKYVAGKAVPGFSLLLFFAKSQEKELDRLLQKMEKANDMLDTLNHFSGVMLNQVKLGNDTARLIADAVAFEQEYSKEFDEILGKYADLSKDSSGQGKRA